MPKPISVKNPELRFFLQKYFELNPVNSYGIDLLKHLFLSKWAKYCADTPITLSDVEVAIHINPYSERFGVFFETKTFSCMVDLGNIRNESCNPYTYILEILCKRMSEL